MTNVSPQSRPRRFYISALIVTAIIVTMTYLAHSHSTAQQIAYSRRINQTTELRNQTHTIIFHAGRLVRATSAEERDALREALHQAVSEASAVKGTWLNEQYSPEINALLFDEPFNLAQKISFFLATSDELADTTALSVNTHAYKQIIALRPLLIDEMTVLAEQLRVEGDAQVIATQHLEGVLFIVILATLGLELVFIFRPMELQIGRAEREQREQLARNQEVTMALRASEERMRLIADNVHDIIAQTNGDGVFTYINSSVRTLMGYEPETLLGTSSYALLHPDDQEAIYLQAQAAVASHTTHLILEYQARHADGQYCWHEAITNYLYDQQGKITGTVTISRDITERKRLLELTVEQERLHTALHKEHELSELKTLMMRGINHEFRTPLAVIQSATETLTNYWDRLTPEGRAAKSARIQAEIRHITAMLDALQLVVTGAFITDKLVFGSTDLSAACREVARRLETEFKLPGKFALDLPASATLRADRDSLHEAVYHVLLNAVQFSQPASVVNINLTMQNEGIDLCVQDAGIGIPFKEQGRIFEPFFRGSNIGEISGLGLGLTIVRLAVDANHGCISVESVPNRGTTVNIHFPQNPVRPTRSDTSV